MTSALMKMRSMLWSFFKIINRSRKVKSELCGNCQQATCLSGQQVSSANFVTGAKVRHAGWCNGQWAVLISDDGHSFTCNYYPNAAPSSAQKISSWGYSSGFVFMCD